MAKPPSPEDGKLAPRTPGRLQLTDRQAEILHAVEKYGTHTEAARHLGVTRQWVSRVIARCEAKGYRSRSARRRDG
jgi:DNA-binding MarR family transcriptional regulator